jgi:hypothetical protein
MKKSDEITRVLLKKFTVSLLNETTETHKSGDGRAAFTTSATSSKVCRGEI